MTSVTSVTVKKAADSKMQDLCTMGDLTSFGAADATPEQRIQAAVAACPVAIFGRSSCPFCVEVKSTFESLKAPYTFFDISKMSDASLVYKALKQLNDGYSTVPYVYVNQKFIKGCDDTKALQATGELQNMLLATGAMPPPSAPSRNGVAPPSAKGVSNGHAPLPKLPVHVAAGAAGIHGQPASGTLFAFPNTIDDRAARFNGVMGCIVCVLVAVFYQHKEAHWTMVGLLADFTLRLIFGHSPIAAMSQLCCSVMELFGSKPIWRPGPPKQFAALCGVMFAGLATFFFLVQQHEKKLEYVGLAFTCGLGMAAGLEGFVGFCLGCYFFSIAIQLGLIDPDVYSTYANSRAEVAYGWEDANKRLLEGAPASHTKSLDPEQPAAVDLHYKAKTDDMTREDFDPIKHTKITHWIMHLSCVGLAAAWKMTSLSYTMGASDKIWHVLGYASAAWYAIFAGLYLIRALKYPGKICKEWMHPVSGNGFALPFICLPLYAFLIENYSHKFAVALFWAGAGPTMALSIIRVGDWIAYRHDIEHINAAWMVMPVGNFVSCFVGPMLDSSYVNAMQFFFAFALMSWALLFTVSFYKAIVHTENDDRQRPLLAIWIAAPAAGALAYLSCFPRSAMTAMRTGDDFIFTNLYWFSICLFLIFVWCFIRPYFGRIKFDMSYWAAGFPAAAVAVASIQYTMMKNGKLSRAIAFTALGIASALNAVLLLNTLAAILRRKVFTPDYKWGPVSFMKLTHEAIKAAIERATSTLDKTTAALESAQDAKPKDGTTSPASSAKSLLMSLTNLWSDIDFVHDVHSFHEDEIIFKTFEEYFPGIAGDVMEEHAEYKSQSEQISTLSTSMLESLSSGTPIAAESIKEFDSLVRTALVSLAAHLRKEEDHLQPVPRRYLPLAVHKQIASRVWQETPATAWFKLLPWIVSNLPMTQQRVRFLKAFLWAVPERAQQMGTMLASGLDPTLWRLVTDELPELAPRGAAGWRRYY